MVRMGADDERVAPGMVRLANMAAKGKLRSVSKSWPRQFCAECEDDVTTDFEARLRLRGQSARARTAKEAEQDVEKKILKLEEFVMDNLEYLEDVIVSLPAVGLTEEECEYNIGLLLLFKEDLLAELEFTCERMRRQAEAEQQLKESHIANRTKQNKRANQRDLALRLINRRYYPEDDEERMAKSFSFNPINRHLDFGKDDKPIFKGFETDARRYRYDSDLKKVYDQQPNNKDQIVRQLKGVIGAENDSINQLIEQLANLVVNSAGGPSVHVESSTSETKPPLLHGVASAAPSTFGVSA